MGQFATRSLPLLALASLLAAGCRPAVEPADLVLVNGKIVTLEASEPEVQALAARGGIIVALGDDGEVRRHVGPDTAVLDLAGALAIPGFIEGHGHFLSLGRARMQLDLTRARTWDEIVAMVAEAASAAQPGEWILGRGWHQEKWDRAPEPSVQGMPTHAALSAASPANPVLLTHASGHAAFANTRALELAGVTAATPDPAGGEIVRDAAGSPTGALRETAQGLVARALEQEWNEATARRQVALATEDCLAKGITSFQDAGSSFREIDFLRTLAERGELDLRLWVMVREGNEALAERLAGYKILGAGGDYLTVRAIKRSIDGALGSHGAWLLAPYEDLPASTGLNTYPVADLAETARLALEHGFQLCVHAIGDRGNRETLDVFAGVFAGRPDARELRWRIEHAQHLHPEDIPRFAELGVIASMQAVHCTSDAPWVPQRIGDQRAEEGAYVWRKLIDSGAVVSNGTDAPVEDVSPIASYYSTVSRRLADGSVFYPDQRMTRMEALESYTKNAAYAAFEEDIKGTLAVGKLADVTVLSRDILTIPEDEIPGTQVRYTIVGGEVRYRGQ